MLTIFSKKNFLIDFLEGCIDIHNHILPGIDDGAKSVEDSITFLKELKAIGINHFICTPHIMFNFYDNNPKTIKKAYKKLRKEMKAHGLKNIVLDYSAEHMIDENFETILNSNDILPLGKNHLLIEMSYLQPSINFEIAVNKIKSSAFFPVFAHPERYQYLNSEPSSYEHYRSMGLKFQLNLLSLGGYYGGHIKKTALKLLEKNAYDYMGSDIHNIEHIKALKSIVITKKNIRDIEELKENNAIAFSK